MSKLIGYIVMLLGVVVISARVVLKNVVAQVPLLNDTKITAIAGLILLIIGFFLTNPSSSTKTPKHLPVYDKTGKKIVGYREGK
jgi:hypothetical protein